MGAMTEIGEGNLAVAVEAAARHAARVPLAETALLAGWVLARTGVQVPDGRPLTVAAGEPRVEDGRIHGLAAAPWARSTGHAVVVLERAGELLVALQPLGENDGPVVERRTNLAGEPMDIRRFDGCPLPGTVFAAPADVTPAAVHARGALARAIQLAGAADAVLAMTLRHIAEREQFGRTLNRFQAIQQQLARLAAEVAAMRTAALSAVASVQAEDDDADLAVAAAKAATSASAQIVAEIGQLHGAIGFTREHRLGTATTRLWSWRDEYGNESEWEDMLGDLILASDSWWATVST